MKENTIKAKVQIIDKNIDVNIEFANKKHLVKSSINIDDLNIFLDIEEYNLAREYNQFKYTYENEAITQESINALKWDISHFITYGIRESVRDEIAKIIEDKLIDVEIWADFEIKDFGTLQFEIYNIEVLKSTNESFKETLKQLEVIKGIIEL